MNFPDTGLIDFCHAVHNLLLGYLPRLSVRQVCSVTLPHTENYIIQICSLYYALKPKLLLIIRKIERQDKDKVKMTLLVLLVLKQKKKAVCKKSIMMKDNRRASH